MSEALKLRVPYNSTLNSVVSEVRCIDGISCIFPNNHYQSRPWSNRRCMSLWSFNEKNVISIEKIHNSRALTDNLRHGALINQDVNNQYINWFLLWFDRISCHYSNFKCGQKTITRLIVQQFFFNLTKKKTTSDRWNPPRRTSDAEMVSMAWYRHDNNFVRCETRSARSWLPIFQHSILKTLNRLRSENDTCYFVKFTFE